jgi:hypothetical protein
MVEDRREDPMSGPESISILFRKECETWVAQCLQYDVAGSGESMDDAEYELQRMLFAHMSWNLKKKQEPFEGISAAPQSYWEEFTRAKALSERSLPPFRAPFPSPAFHAEKRVR